MKKILFLTSVCAALTLSVTSCDMDLRPPGTIEPENALLSIDDADRLRDGLYIAFRGRVGGTYATLNEIRSDEFHASAGFGNNGGYMYYWGFTASDGDVLSLWSSSYYAIANANFFIEKASTVDTSDDDVWSEENIATLKSWIGEAYFMRAYYHYELARMWCLDYVGNESEYGIPYVTTYNPTSDQSQYPNRGTLAQTYANIVSDLDSAAAYITTEGAIGNIWISKDAVTALQARVALAMGDYTKVTSLITSEFLAKYPLVSSSDEFNNMWVNDSGAECILQFDASYPSALGASYDFGYIGYNSSENRYAPNYYPEQWVVDIFHQYPDDFRNNHMRNTTVTVTGGTTYDLYILYKFPGNPALRENETDQNYQHKPKVFRIAEMYLVLAEAYASLGDYGNASNVLNDLRSARIPGFIAENYGSDVLNEIKEERVRELIGEGFRMDDLKRYARFGQSGVQRGAAQIPASIYMPSENQSFHRDVTDYRFIFPIPQEEIDSNPNIANQQNPGY